MQSQKLHFLKPLVLDFLPLLHLRQPADKQRRHHQQVNQARDKRLLQRLDR